MVSIKIHPYYIHKRKGVEVKETYENPHRSLRGKDTGKNRDQTSRWIIGIHYSRIGTVPQLMVVVLGIAATGREPVDEASESFFSSASFFGSSMGILMHVLDRFRTIVHILSPTSRMNGLHVSSSTATRRAPLSTIIGGRGCKVLWRGSYASDDIASTSTAGRMARLNS
jgi:hypothetical protein